MVKLICAMIAVIAASFSGRVLWRLIQEERSHRRTKRLADRTLDLIHAVDWTELPAGIPVAAARAVQRGDYELAIHLLSPYQPTWESDQVTDQVTDQVRLGDDGDEEENG